MSNKNENAKMSAYRILALGLALLMIFGVIAATAFYFFAAA